MSEGTPRGQLSRRGTIQRLDEERKRGKRGSGKERKKTDRKKGKENERRV
jgi:hypothetical protein